MRAGNQSCKPTCFSCGYLTEKIICRRCIRTIVAFGFHSDGKEYVAVAKDKAEEIERS